MSRWPPCIAFEIFRFTFIDRGITGKRDLTACQNMVSMYILFKNEIMKGHEHQLMAQEEWLMAHQHGLYIYNVYNLVEKSMFAKVVIKTNAVATRPASALLMVPRWNDQPTSPWIEIGFWQIEIAMDNGPFVDDLPIKKFWCSIAMLR